MTAASDAARLPSRRSCRALHQHVEHRMMKMPIRVATPHAEYHPRCPARGARRSRHRLRSPSGAEPKMKAKEVIRIGRRRRRAPSIAASPSGLPALVRELGELDDEMAFFLPQADQHHQADMGVDVARHATQREADISARARRTGCPAVPQMAPPSFRTAPPAPGRRIR